jgi:hypothetical protein
MPMLASTPSSQVLQFLHVRQSLVAHELLLTFSLSVPFFFAALLPYVALNGVVTLPARVAQARVSNASTRYSAPSQIGAHIAQQSNSCSTCVCIFHGNFVPSSFRHLVEHLHAQLGVRDPLDQAGRLVNTVHSRLSEERFKVIENVLVFKLLLLLSDITGHVVNVCLECAPSVVVMVMYAVPVDSASQAHDGTCHLAVVVVVYSVVVALIVLDAKKCQKAACEVTVNAGKHK